MDAAQQIVFGSFRLEPVTTRLWRGEHLIDLQPRPFAVLHYLAQRPGQTVAKEELLTQIWAGTYVTKAVLKVSIRAIREALGDEATAAQYIETVGRVGYRFLGSGAEGQLSGGSPRLARTPQDILGVPSSLVVGRHAELAQLHHWVRASGMGARQMVFITGEPGVGKTTVVDMLLERLRSTGEWWIGRGQCLEQYGEGEAYLPVLEALGQICRGPGGKQALALLQRYAPTWVVQMPAFVTETELEHLQRKVAGATQGRMLREMAEALEALTVGRGLVLVVEDLHVSDRSTVDLLAYLAQRREQAKLLILGTYRPTEVVVREHPLKGVKQALSAHDQCQELRLGLLSPAAVGEYMAKRLAVAIVPTELPQLIYQRTDGNALFMVNVVEYCLQQNWLVQEGGQWRLKGNPEALGVPESVQQMIRKQLDELGAHKQQVLEVASVAGREFAVAAVAAALPSEIDAIEDLCEELAEKSHLLREAGVTEWPDGTWSGRYAFRHVLYQNVLYARIATVRRVRVHRLIGERQEQAYGARSREIASELAMHFEQGRVYQKAVQYLQQAGENATRRSAHQEAINYLRQALGLLKNLPQDLERIRQELALQVALGVPLSARYGYAAPEVEKTYTYARELARRVGETPQLFSTLQGLCRFYMVRADFATARELGEQLFRLAQKQQADALLLEAHWVLGVTLVYHGELIPAKAHLEQGLALYDRRQHSSHAFIYGQDPGVACQTYAAWLLGILGYPDQALQRSQEALTLARELAHPFSLDWALHHAAILHQQRRDGEIVQQQARELIELATEQEFPFWLAMAHIAHGGELARQDLVEEGITQMHQGLAAHRAMGADIGSTYWLALLAEAYGKKGQSGDGLKIIAEALVGVRKGSEHLWEAELYRIKGELQLIQTGERVQQRSRATGTAEEEAKKCFCQAIEIARLQGAKLWELRAAVSLSRLWQKQGKKKQARQLLTEIYGWFTEGFDTKDLQEAKALLEELA